LLGQVWIAVDPSDGPTGGYIYLLSSVDPDGPDPQDVHFSRSTDGGLTWSEAVRVNDDPIGNDAWQWFGTMSVAPNGRIDAIWNDTRNTGVLNQCQLFYAFSTDGGVTWSTNAELSPSWNSWLGFPNNNKIGDYYHMISDIEGTHIAWAATFNGEQDIYYAHRPTVGVSEDNVATLGPRALRLHQNTPNPFNPSTSIAFDLPHPTFVTLRIYDTAGRHVRTLVDGRMEPDSHSVLWDGVDDGGTPLGSGVYFYRLVAGDRMLTRKLVMLR
jgi:hypothetical protein